MKKFLHLLIPVILFSFLKIENASAIPAFARKYRISCLTCHSPSVPRLKAFGDDFAGDGFRLEDYESPRYFVETGDDKLSLIREFPLAVRLDGYVTYNIAQKDNTDFAAPYLVKLLSGGELSKNISYYFYFYMDERREVAGVEDAYLMYNNLFGQDLDIYLGQFQVSDPLFKRELRLTLEDYHLYTAPVGMSEISLKYDKGIMLTYGLPSSTDIILEIVNGNGLAEAEDHVFDKDNYKSVVGRISQDVGDFLRLGFFGYYGKEKLDYNGIDEIGATVTNKVSFIGPDATISFGDKLEFNLQYLVRRDDQVTISPSSMGILNDVKTDGFLGEFIFSPQGDQSNWYTVGLFNYVKSDYQPANYKSASLHLGYLMNRNIRLGGEYSYIFTDSDNAFGQLSFGFVSAF